MEMQPEAPFGEGVEPIIVKRPYWKKLAITFAVMGALAAIIGAIVGSVVLGLWIGGHFGGGYARAVGGCTAVIILFALAIASSDWDSEDGY